MAIFVVVLLGLTLGGAVNTLSLGNNNSRLLEVLNSNSFHALDVLLRINVLSMESSTTTTTTPVSPVDLEAIMRAEISGDWERARLVMQLAGEARTLPLKRAIYEALWLEMQQSKQIYNPHKLLDFYEQLQRLADVPPALLEQLHQAFVSRSAQLLAAPFYTSSCSASFPQVNELVERLSLSSLDYLRDILEAVFNLVLSLESTLTVVQRVGNFNSSLTHLTCANLQLLQRSELQSDLEAQAAVQQNLRQLLLQPAFAEEVDYVLRLKVYAQLSPDEHVLYTAQKVCLRNVSDDNAYIYECPQTYLICTNARDPKKAGYQVLRGSGGVNNTSMQVAFQSSFWSNRYMRMEPNNQTASNSILKSVYSRDTSFWWELVLVPQAEGGGVALYDADTNGLVLCGGNPEHWDGVEHHVYTRVAQDFEAYRNECVWSLEDCSDEPLK